MRKRKNLVIPRVPLSYSVPLLIVCIAVFFVLFSWYLGGIPNIMLQAVPVNVINVTSCGTLSQNNAYYVLNSSLSFTTSNCITIQGDNVTLDGEFKHLITSSAPYSYTASAVLSLGKNVTIQRLNITVPVSRGIVIYGSNSVVNSNVIKDSYVAAVIGAAATPSGVIFSNNVINRAYIGISIWDATKVEILDNTISNTNNSVDIGLFGGQSILLKNLNIINQSPLTNSLTITDAVANGNVPGPPNFIDIVDSSFTSYQIANAFTTFTSTGKGEINFTQPISGGVMTQGVSGRNLNDDVKIEYNYAYVNSTRAGLNVPARITFEGLPTNLVNPVMLRNGLSCPANICTNLTSLNAGTVVFNVTGWTDYSINLGGAPVVIPVNAINVSSCGVLSRNNTYYVLNASFTASISPCISIIGNNVTLDGTSRYSISPATGLSSVGIDIVGSNVSVARVNLRSFRVGIASGNRDSYIYGNSIVGSGIVSSGFTSVGIDLYETLRSRVAQNLISNVQVGINLNFSNKSLIERNVLNKLNPADLLDTGILLYLGFNNSIDSNTITRANYSITLSNSNHNNISNNILLNSSISGVYSILSGFNSFSNVSILNPRRDGIVLVSGIPIYNSFKNVNVINGNSSHYDLDVNSPYFASTSSAYVDIIDSSFKSYRINNSFVNLINTSNGRINFTQPFMNVNGLDLGSDIHVERNLANVESALRPRLNVPARITFEGLPTNLVNPVMLRNGLSCPANICTNLTSLNAGTVVFNVTGWTNYSISSVINPNNNSSNNNTYSNISINEPDSGDLYTVLDFPVVFDVNLSMNGSVKFSLNGGVANITMNTLNRRTFTYSQSLLLIGNYTFTAYANFSNGVNESLSVDFRVVDIVPTMSINEHSPDDSYALSAFPVTFNISLNLNGSVNFSLNNGVTNTTMNTTNNRLFTYSQGLLPVGNYVLTAYSNFLNGAKRNATVNFVVVNNPNNPGGSSGGSGGGGGRRSTTGIARNNSNISY